MPRYRRELFNGATYHVMNRGVNKANIFLHENHKKFFLKLVSKFFEEFNVNLHCYCLMDNHYHMLLTTPDANLSKVMQVLSSKYTLSVNKTFDRDGPLFKGRFKSKLVEDDSYLVDVARYIHKNPSAAGIVENDIEYKWSSYKFYASDAYQKPNWLHMNEVLGIFNNKKAKFVKYCEDKEFVKNLKPYQFCDDLPTLKELVDFFLQYYDLEDQFYFRRASVVKNEKILFYALLDSNKRYTKVEKAKFLSMSPNSFRINAVKAHEEIARNGFLAREFINLKQALYK